MSAFSITPLKSLVYLLSQSDWNNKLPGGNYYANAYDSTLTGFFWDPFTLLNQEDDGDGHLDDLLTLCSGIAATLHF